ncbi:MAG: hypothetical protein JNJ88_01425, partial [Planctomycetes bacterium]|nr:hypothetical protein [Planctomycetota bacterium]
MTHHDAESTVYPRILEVLLTEGFGGLAEALQMLLNEMMKIERARFLRADSHERTEER